MVEFFMTFYEDEKYLVEKLAPIAMSLSEADQYGILFSILESNQLEKSMPALEYFVDSQSLAVWYMIGMLLE